MIGAADLVTIGQILKFAISPGRAQIFLTIILLNATLELIPILLVRSAN